MQSEHIRLQLRHEPCHDRIIDRHVRSSNACRQEAIRMSDSPTGVLDGKLFADVPETAQILRYDQRTVRRAIEAGEIPAVRAGGRWRIPTSWLREQARIGDSDAATA